MNIIFILLLNFSFSLNSFNCSKQAKNDPLPGSRPDKLVIEYHKSGGMRYYSEALYISEDTSYYTVNDGGAISRANFFFNPEELDELYKVFTDNSFDKIQTYEEKVYDRGGSSIYIRWAGGKFNSVSNSGMTFISDNWQGEWSRCVSALEKIIAKQVSEQQKNYTISFDESFGGKDLSVYVNSRQVFKKIPAESKDTVFSRTVMLIPGSYRLSVAWDKRSENIIVNTDSTKSVNLYLYNDSLKYKFFPKDN